MNDVPVGLTVLLADDQAATRAGVRKALESQGLVVVAEASTAAAAVRAALAHRPDVCLLSISMPGSGITAAEQISQAVPESKIVMLTESERDEDLFAAVRAGAVGYLLKTTSPERLPHALMGVADGEAALPRTLTARLLRELRKGGHRRRVAVSDVGDGIELTQREFEVLQLLRQPARTSQIAAQLRISEVTVRRHISSILHKLHVPDRRAALELLDREERRQLENLG